MSNLELVFPEIFLSLSIMFLLILGVFKKNSSKLIQNISLVILLITAVIIFNESISKDQTLLIYHPPYASNYHLSCDENDAENAAKLNAMSGVHTLTYLHRPFGRPNTIVNNDRGWLFLERITIAIKAAAAEKSQFDDIVVSNCEKLRLQIFK